MNTEITRDTRISITMVIVLLTAVWQVAQWKGEIHDCKEEIERLETRIERLEVAVP